MSPCCQAVVILLAAATVAAPIPASAVEIQTESFDGLRVLIVSGEFEPDENPRKLARSLLQSEPDFVTFNSPGGNIYTAMEFGRAIRAHGADTLQVRGFECASACSLAFLGGVERAAQPGSIGVHKTSFVGAETLSAEDAISAVQSATAEVVAYLAEMGVDPGLLQLALSYESWDIRYLSGSEMLAHRVVTTPWGEEGQTTASTPTAPPVARQTPPAETTFELVTTEDARSGVVRRPKGFAPVKAAPSTNAEEILTLRNGAPVSILGTSDRWFRVRSGDEFGWMHHTWIKVDQFHDAGFDAKHVQIKSFDNARDVDAYLEAMPFSLDVYTATNGWLAITLDGTYGETDAERLLAQMKASGQIPDDSFQTFGNTYMQKLCCD